MGWADALADIAEAKADPGRPLPRNREAPPARKATTVAADRQAVGQSRGHRRAGAVTVSIPPLDPLTHRAAYFNAIERSPLHGGLLDGRRGYYR
jgi:hypothetical protein